MRKRRQAQKSEEVTEISLRELLPKCTSWPWVATMGDGGIWMIVGANGKVVSSAMDSGITNYDLRLMAMAPRLAIEVYRLQQIIRELRDKKTEYEALP